MGWLYLYVPMLDPIFNNFGKAIVTQKKKSVRNDKIITNQKKTKLPSFSRLLENNLQQSQNKF